MNHPLGGDHLGELLSAYLDGELTATESPRVAGHLQGCGRCRAELDDLASARAAIRSLPIIEVPPGVLGLPESNVISLRRRPMMWAATAAAAAVAIFVGAATLLAPPPSVVTPSDLSQLFGARSSADLGFTPSKVAAVADAAQLAE